MRWALAALLTAALQAQGDTPVPAHLDATAFAGYDPESRWLLYRQSRTRGAKVEAWVRFLEARRDFDLLAMMCLYEGFKGVFDKARPGAVLVRHDDHRWPQLAHWNLRAQDSHGAQAAQTPLSKHPGLLWSWVKRFPQARKLGGPKFANLLKQVKQPAALPDSSRYAPPLDPDQLLLPLLRSDAALPVLEPGQKPEKGVRYAHQLRRAIRVVGHFGGRLPQAYQDCLLRLCAHPMAGIRRTALLTWQSIPSAKVPMQPLLAIYNDADRPDTERNLALLALLRTNRPQAWVLAHHLLMDPEHPHWTSALLLVRGWSDSFTLARLRLLRRKEPSEAQNRELDVAIAAVDRREKKRRKKAGSVDGEPLDLVLRRLSWARHMHRDVHAAYLAWLLIEQKETLDSKRVQDQLATMVNRPVKDLPAPVAGEYGRMVKQFFNR